ncbi:MAG: hypothetical protein KDD53_11445, partial [Bdellovibrionales bacterium]|nr:hypothetical protein [Bdellovibrionales bacterium]
MLYDWWWYTDLAGDSSMLIEILPRRHFKQVEGRSWGYLSPPERDLPNWVRNIPRCEHLRFLATGPDFYGSDREEDYIASSKLIGSKSQFPARPKTLREATIDWYLL